MSSTSVNTNPAPVQHTLDSSREIAKANLYLMMSRAFSLPSEMDNNLPDQLRSLIPELPTGLQDESVRLATEWEKALEKREPLSLAFARLFLGPFEILAPPYASFYLEPDQQLMGQVSQHVARVYAEAGLGPGLGPREVPDHVALEWEFMYYLTHQYIVTGEKHWLERLRTFRLTHLERWMPSFAKAITQAREHEFYNALAALVTALLKNSKR